MHSLNASVIEAGFKTTRSFIVDFDRDLPHYETNNGLLQSPSDQTAQIPLLMWIEALDQLFVKMQAHGVVLNNVAAIAGAALPQCPIFLLPQSTGILNHLDSKRSLKSQLVNALARNTAPCQLDLNASTEAAEIRKAMGSAQNCIIQTGSDCTPYSTAAHICSLASTDVYRASTQLTFSGSFMASILSGGHAHTHISEGAATGLLHIKSQSWSAKAAQLTADRLLEKLPPLCGADRQGDSIATYFVEKYEFSPHTLVYPWLADSSARAAGMGLTEPGILGINLDYHDTAFALLSGAHPPSGDGQLIFSFNKQQMGELLIRNGDVARLRMRNRYGLDNIQFEHALEDTPAGNSGNFIWPYLYPETTPLVKHAETMRYGFEERQVNINCRAIIEAQACSLSIHSAWMKPKRVVFTGKAASSKELQKIFCNVLQCPFSVLPEANYAAKGAARRAMGTVLCKESEKPISQALQINPDTGLANMYRSMCQRYRRAEQQAHII